MRSTSVLGISPPTVGLALIARTVSGRDHFAAAAAAAAVVIVVVAGGLLTIFTLSLFLSLPLALLPCHLFVFGRERLQWKLD